MTGPLALPPSVYLCHGWHASWAAKAQPRLGWYTYNPGALCTWTLPPGISISQCRSLCEHVTSTTWAEAFDWNWIPLDNRFHVERASQTLQLPAASSTQPTTAVLPIALRDMEPFPAVTRIEPTWRLCSCNVFSLLGSRSQHFDD